MKVCINAGHASNGNPDPGAVGQTGLRESDVAYNIMGLVAQYLQQAGYNTLQVQDDSLQLICNQSNDFEADLFISIHCNAAASDQAKGTETFAYLDGSAGYKLADCIQDQIVNSMETVDRGVKTNGFYVLRYTDCPAVLVECAFISNTDDELLLANRQDDFARAIARGITDYVG
jgi:N-acetylmuramoyl-L-alanine amidase